MKQAWKFGCIQQMWTNCRQYCQQPGIVGLGYTVKTGVFSYTLSGVYWNTFLHWGVLLHS